MEFLQLMYFCSAAETENFAKTAREFNVPPASISQSIKRIEKEIGKQLFDRSANGVKLNELGRIWYHSSKSSLLLLKDAQRKINEEEISGNIKVLVMTNKHFVNEAISSFLKKHSKVSFAVDYYEKDTFDKYDLVITDNFSTAYNPKDFQTINFYEDEMCLALSKNHPLAQKENPGAEDWEGLKFLTGNKESGLYSITRRILNKKRVFIETLLEIDSPELIMKCVEDEIGAAIIPKYEFSHLITDNIRIVKIPEGISRDLRFKPTKISSYTHRYESKAIRLFKEELRQVAKKIMEN